MKPVFGKLRRSLDKALDAFATAVFLAIFGVILLQVFMRYVLGSPLVWTEELARYLFIWISFLGWVFAIRTGSHIRIGFLADSLPPALSKILAIASSLLSIAFACALGWYGFVMMRKNFDIPTITLFVSYAAVYAAVPVSCALIILYSAFEIIDRISGRGRIPA